MSFKLYCLKFKGIYIMSFAIIETGGKQYRVSASKILEIEKLEVEMKWQ